MTDERRTSKRFAVQLNKITGAEVTRADDVATPCYVYVVDISEGGLRITTDSVFDVGEQFGLHLQLNPPLTSRVEVVWHKALTGGTNVHGVKFVDMSADLSAQVAAFIESYSDESRRRTRGLNLNRVLSMQFPEVTKDARIYALTAELSTEGMRITTETAFEEGRAYACRLWLETERPPVELTAMAREVKQAVFDRFKVSFGFEAIDADVRARIDAFLDSVVSG